MGGKKALSYLLKGCLALLLKRRRALLFETGWVRRLAHLLVDCRANLLVHSVANLSKKQTNQKTSKSITNPLILALPMLSHLIYQGWTIISFNITIPKNYWKLSQYIVIELFSILSKSFWNIEKIIGIA